jgi:ribonuclease T2
MLRVLLLVVIAALPARADEAGRFDYFVLSMSWSPNWCAGIGDADSSEQCDQRHDFGWIAHGLWPQHEQGYPQDCRTQQRDPSRRETAAMADIMGTGDLAWYQWKKHGRCADMDPADYFSALRRAYERVNQPDVLARLDEPVRLPASVVEEAFLEANPGWDADMLTITCKSGFIQEARLCLTRDLDPRKCGADVRRDCRMTDAVLEPIR